MTMNSLPFEILEKIIKFASEEDYISEYVRKYYLKRYALENRRWTIHVAKIIF
jgi:hypothetical protein